MAFKVRPVARVFPRIVERELSPLFARLDPDFGPFVPSPTNGVPDRSPTPNSGVSMANRALFAGPRPQPRSGRAPQIDEAFD